MTFLLVSQNIRYQLKRVLHILPILSLALEYQVGTKTKTAYHCTCTETDKPLHLLTKQTKYKIKPELFRLQCNSTSQVHRYLTPTILVMAYKKLDIF